MQKHRPLAQRHQPERWWQVQRTLGRRINTGFWRHRSPDSYFLLRLTITYSRHGETANIAQSVADGRAGETRWKSAPFWCVHAKTQCRSTLALARGCRGADVKQAHQLCRAEIERFRAASAGGAPLTVACTQEAPLFSEVAGERASAITFNIRETAGWSSDAAKAGPKMAACSRLRPNRCRFALSRCRAKASLDLRPRRTRDRSCEPAQGSSRHHGAHRAARCARALRITDFPVVKGNIRSAKGHLGAFELTIDDYAAPDPSSRGAEFGVTRDGAVSRCDLLLDLSGGAPLFTAADLRDGYLRADPNDPAAVLRAVLKARDLTGTFDKPRYVTFTEDLCAHSRSKIIGCHRCLDLCPTGAITPAGDHVAIDAQICAGCGQCAAVCPTGAAAYALPSADAFMRKLRAEHYREAGGATPVILLTMKRTAAR
jgi:Pyruvate/2-oxoacid:ferredoxin oxidoreductase delta subunit